MNTNHKAFSHQLTRLGVVLEPDGDLREADGILNPASARLRDGQLVLYTRSVAHGNVSRVGMVKATDTNDGKLDCQRVGYALEPEAIYESRTVGGGKGCEDPRVTFIAVLNLYVMAYTAYGDAGPRIAVAVSDDGYAWKRVGLLNFPAELGLVADDKDAAFFPEPVISPDGVRSIAMYHRPMVQIPRAGTLDDIQSILARPAQERQSIRIAYMPLDPVLENIENITQVKESVLVLSPNSSWGCVKVGGGTPPVRIAEGWLSIYHGVDAILKEPGRYAMRYSAGLIVHDADQPHKVLYQSETPLFVPETAEELTGTVNNVVFPTAIDPRPELSDRTFDLYYGMADFRIGRARLVLDSSEQVVEN